MPTIHVLSRSATPADSESTGISSPIYIAGIAVAGAIALGVGLWLSIRFYRIRAAAKRESQMGAAFLSVKGLVREDSSIHDEKDPFAASPMASSTFSRNQLGHDSTIVLPDKALSRPNREEIIQYHRQSGNFPSSFAAKPFSFALGTASPPSSILEPPNVSYSKSRNSTLSFASIGSRSQNRFSVMSGISTTSTMMTTSGTPRKVRQLYEPVLPDELLISFGEHLTVMQSFDDGWCVIGRESSTIVHQAKSLFKTAATPSMVEGSNVELGVVPAWVFLKPVKGLRAERPVRSSSLGITVKLDSPGFSSRNELVSWSNF